MMVFSMAVRLAAATAFSMAVRKGLLMAGNLVLAMVERSANT